MKSFLFFSLAAIVTMFLAVNLALATGWQCPYNKNACYNTAADCYAAETSCGVGNSPTPCVQTGCNANNPQPLNPNNPSPAGNNITLPNPLGSTNDIYGIIKNIITFLSEVAVPIVAGMVIYGAYQMLFAGGDPEKFATGRRTIIYAVVGYAIILIGWGITTILQSILSG